MKNKGLIITLIVIIVTAIVGLGMLLFGLITGGITKIFSESYIEEKIIDEKYETIFENINIDYDVAKVVIKESDEPVVRLVIYGEKDKTNVEVTDTKLEVTSRIKKCVGFCFKRKQAKIEIYVPKDYKNEITTQGDVGDIKVESIENLKLNSDINVGDINIDKAEKVKIKLNTGDVKIDEVKNLEVDGKVRDVKVESVNETLDIDIKTGDVKINKVYLISNGKIKTNVGDIKIQEINDIYVSAKSNVGDTKINSNRKSDIELETITNVGDIKVNY